MKNNKRQIKYSNRLVAVRLTLCLCMAIGLFAHVKSSVAQSPVPNPAAGNTDIFGTLIAPMQKMTEQLSTAISQVTTNKASQSDAAAQQDVAGETQEVIYEHGIKHAQNDGVTCPLISIGSAPAVETQILAQEAHHELSHTLSGISGASSGTPGTQGALRHAQSLDNLYQRYCDPQEQAGANEALCEALGGVADEGADIGAFADPTKLLSTLTVDCDLQDDMDSNECTNLISALSYTGPGHTPLSFPTAADAQDERLQDDIVNYFLPAKNHANVIIDTQAYLASKNTRGSDAANAQMTALLEGLGMDEATIKMYIPETGGPSEDALFDITVNYLLANPKTFVDMHAQGANVYRINAMITALSTRLDNKILEMTKHKNRQIAGILALRAAKAKQAADGQLLLATER